MGEAVEMTVSVRKIRGGSVPSVPMPASLPDRSAPSAGYLRDTRSGVFAGFPVYLASQRDDVRRAWPRSAALALNLLQNSGKLRGAADQVLTDTVGTGLALNFQPNFAGIEMGETEREQFVSDVKTWWREWQGNRVKILVTCR